MLSLHGAFYLQIAVPFPEVAIFSQLVYASLVVALALHHCLHFSQRKGLLPEETFIRAEVAQIKADVEWVGCH